MILLDEKSFGFAVRGNRFYWDQGEEPAFDRNLTVSSYSGFKETIRIGPDFMTDWGSEPKSS